MSTSDSSEHSDVESKHLAVYDIILMVTQAHHANCDYTEEQTRGLLRRPISSPVSFPDSKNMKCLKSLEHVKQKSTPPPFPKIAYHPDFN